jgi:hypothetical protein
MLAAEILIAGAVFKGIDVVERAVDDAQFLL